MILKRSQLYTILVTLIMLLALLAYEIHLHRYYSYFQIIISFLMALLFLLLIKDDKLKNKLRKLISFHPFIIVMLLLMIVCTFLSFFVYKYNGMKSVLSSILYFVTSLTTFYAIPLLIKENDIIKERIFNIYISFTTFLSFFSLLIKLFGNSFLGYGLVNYRISSIYFDPNFLGVVLGISFLLVFLRKMRLSKKILICVPHAIAIFLTNSRGTLLAIVIALFIYFIFYHKTEKRKKIIIITIYFICAFVFVAYLYFNTHFFRLYQGDNYRTEMISFAFHMTLKSPLIGYGYGSIANCLKLMSGTAAVHVSTHNSFIDFLFAYGFPTFVIFISILFKLFIRTLRMENEEFKKYILATIFILINANTILYSFGGVGLNSIMFTLLLGLINIHTLSKSEEKIYHEV